MARKKRLYDESKHVAILKAAIKLFLKHGYTGTTMDDVADAARVTKQTVYAHYQSKDMLFKQMITQLCSKYIVSEDVLSNHYHKIDTVLYHIGLSYLGMVTSTEGLATTRLVVAESKRHPRMAKLFYESSTQRMVDSLSLFLKQRKKMGHVTMPDTANAASCFLSMLSGGCYVRMMLGVSPVLTMKQKESHVRETVRNFMAIYGNKKTAALRKS